MGRGTGIQWCDDTVNPTTGCDGCELWKSIEESGVLKMARKSCYAGVLHERRLAKAMPARYAADFHEVRLVAGRMAKAAAAADLAGTDRPDKPWLDGLPRVIFLGDMSDVMSKAVPFEYLLSEIVEVVTSKAGRRHIYMMLSKRPGRMAEFGRWLKAEHGRAWPDNLWAGTSVTNKATVGRVRELLKVPAANRFVSVEPLVEEVSLAPYLPWDSFRANGPGWVPNPDFKRGLRLVIVGGESDQAPHDARPFHLGWAMKLREECELSRTAFFLKQLGSHPVDYEGNRMRLRDTHGGDWNEWPGGFGLASREFPSPAERIGA